MMEIPDRLFDKIAIDLVTECKTSTLGNKHILTIIDHLTGYNICDCTIFILFNDIKLLLVHLYGPTHVFSQVSFILLHLLYL